MKYQILMTLAEISARYVYWTGSHFVSDLGKVFLGHAIATRVANDAKKQTAS
jgi:hypothetical protein